MFIMKRSVSIFLIVYFVIVFLPLIESSVGLSPGSYTLDFSPGLQKNLYFTFLFDADTEAEISAVGALNDNFLLRWVFCSNPLILIRKRFSEPGVLSIGPLFFAERDKQVLAICRCFSPRLLLRRAQNIFPMHYSDHPLEPRIFRWTLLSNLWYCLPSKGEKAESVNKLWGKNEIDNSACKWLFYTMWKGGKNKKKIYL